MVHQEFIHKLIYLGIARQMLRHNFLDLPSIEKSGTICKDVNKKKSRILFHYVQ